MKTLSPSVKTFIFTFFALSLSSGNAIAGKLYKWVDANGVISYQDQPPPENAKILSETLVDDSGNLNDTAQNQQAVVVYTVPNCDSCASLLSRLVAYGVPVSEQSLQNNREAQQRILELSDSLIAPTLIINGQAYSNPNQENLVLALENAGYELLKPKPKIILPNDDPDNQEGDSRDGLPQN